MIIDRIFKKKQNPQTVYTLLYYANDKRFVDSLTEEQRQWLIHYIANSNIEDCVCCPCFAWEFDEAKNNITGCICTLGGIPSETDIGECTFVKEWPND